MKDKIKQLSREHFEYELPKLICSTEKIETEVETGRVHKGTFVLKNSEGEEMKGLLYTTSHLLCLSTDSFCGKEITVEYVFHAEDVRARDVQKGCISIVSSCGEKEIPFEIKVTDKVVESSFGEIKDLFHFTNLAKINWTKAVSIFKSTDFESVFLKKNSIERNLYHGLIKSEDINQALEEFLIAIQKKEVCEISVSQDFYEYKVKKENASGSIQLTKSSWGYMEIMVHCDQDFVQPEQRKITNESFIGNEYELQFEIDNNKLHPGKNYADIIFENVHQKIMVRIEVEKYVKRMERDYEGSKIRRHEIILVNNYINFRSNRIAISEYVEAMRESVTQLECIQAMQRNLGELGYSRRMDLYHMHLYMVEGKEEKAREILTSLEQEEVILKKHTVEDYCGYLYLKALFTRRDMDLQIALREIRECYKQNKHSWIMLWFLLFLDEKYEHDPKEKIEAIEAQYALGCTSPVLYYEICSSIENDPTLLGELTPCMIQVMNMAVKMEMHNEEIANQYAYLAERAKKHGRIMFHTLVHFYEVYHSKEVLAAICGILIKSNIVEPSSFGWYEAGVKELLHMTQLYEYYMYAIDEEYEGRLPKEVYLYFAYNTNTLEEKKSFLYANVIRHRGELSEEYAMYEPIIRTYVYEQLAKGKIDHQLSFLYRHFITEYDISAQIAKQLPEVLFKHKITCSEKFIVGVVVAHKECREEVYTTFDSKGCAYIDIYTDDAQIFLVGEDGNRYTASVPWELERLMEQSELAFVCFEKNPDNRMLCLYVYERMDYYQNRSIKISEFQRYIDSDWLKPEYRKKWIMRLIQSYYDNYEGDALESLLHEIDLQGMSKSDRNLVMEYCIIRGLYDLAYEQMRKYSFEGISVKRLRALCSKMIKKQGMEQEDSLLTKLAFFVFKAGKYDEYILQYLVRYYLGTTKDMFLVWREAKEYEMDALDLEERLLGQILFAESYVHDAMAVFLSFYKEDQNRMLVKAFISFYSYKYLVRDRVLDEAFFHIVRKELEIEENKTALYALLKYYSTLEQWNKEQVQFIKLHVERLLEEGVTFPFFQIFARKLNMKTARIENVCFVEYKTNPKSKVLLHFFVEDEEMGEGFVAEEMENIFEGIFVKTFTLFQNETLQYYVEEIVEGAEPIITESITLRSDDVFSEEEDEYAQINMMLIAREMKDEKTLLSLLQNFAKNEYAMKRAFKMLE